MKRLLFTLFALAFILGSCNKAKQNTTTQVTFDSIHVVKVYHINNDSTQPSFNLTLDYVYPTAMKDTSVLRKLQQNFNRIYFEDDAYIKESADSAIAQYISNSIASYDTEIKTYYENPNLQSDSEPYLSYYDKIKGDVLFKKNNVVSFQISRFINKGKATHTTYFNYVFDLETGEQIEESDIFNTYFEAEMTPLIIDKILKENKVKTITELTDIGYLQDIIEIIPNKNFIVDDKGITYIFNKGEYSALPLNEMRISFSYNEIKDILKENSPISSLIGK